MRFAPRSALAGLITALLLPLNVFGLSLDINDPQSITRANNAACKNAMLFYHGDTPGNTPGLVDPPHYWWQAGALFGLLIQRWSITGDDSLNKIIIEGLEHQIGEQKNYEPSNHTSSLGNDDQVFWALAAMDAAELGFPDPPKDQPSWLALAQAVFNRQTARWDKTHCNGGLRWQIFPWNSGYDYKNSISNGGYFQLAARLARYTTNATYAEYAKRTYKWMESSALFHNTSYGLQIWDGIRISNCSAADELFWSYNPSTLIVGAAYMYNYSEESSVWRDRINDLLPTMDIYHVRSSGSNTDDKASQLGGDILSEVACERVTPQTCNQDQPSFKGYASRWLSMTTILAPFTRPTIWPRLQASAKGAAAQCSGNGPGQPPGTSCGRRWYQSKWDGYYGLGEHMSAMSVFQSLLISQAKAPVTLKSGGTSQGDAGAGAAPPAEIHPVFTNPIFVRDKVGAALLTVISCVLAIGTSAFMIMD